MDMIRGAKTKLSDAGLSDTLDVGVKIALSGDVDISAFGLDANGKLSDDRYFVFYNQKASPCNSVKMVDGQGGDTSRFSLNLAGLPASIQRIVFTATVDGGPTMGQLGQSHLRLLNGGSESVVFRFQGSDFGSEKAIMIAEIYKKDVWRFAAVGQGFAGGLQALLEHFGGAAADAPKPAAAPAPVAKPAPAPAPAPAAPAPKINLGKVTLEKRGARQAISLKKGASGGASGATQFHINLNWDKPAPEKKSGIFGFGKSNQPNVDLDLGCMFKLITGEKGCIQPLGGYFGSKTESPFIFLDKDDRSGAAADGENMHVYRPEMIDKIVFFAMIYEGTANFATVNARLTLKDDTGTEILIKLDNPDSSQKFCAVAQIERGSGGLEVVKEERYFAGHRFCDEHFGFGFNWKAGSK